jgi:hypothetical protein
MKNFLKSFLLIGAGALGALVIIALVISSAPKSKSPVGLAQFGGAAGREIMPAVAPFPLVENTDRAEVGGAVAFKESAAGDATSNRVIKTADLEMQVQDAAEAIESAKAVAAAKQGFVLLATMTGTEKGERTARISLRVPVSSFDSAIADLKKLASLVVSESASGQDVTEEFVDLESQIKNAQAEEAQYLLILKQAVKISDILEVTARLTDVRGRIEQLQGRKQYLVNRTDYSTISATMSEEPVVKAPTSKWRPLQVAREAVKFLVVVFEALVNFLIVALIIGAGLLLPIILALLVIFLLGRFVIRRYLKRS